MNHVSKKLNFKEELLSDQDEDEYIVQDLVNIHPELSSHKEGSSDFNLLFPKQKDSSLVNSKKRVNVN